MVCSVDTMIETNAVRHVTTKYRIDDSSCLVLRRGDSFFLTIKLLKPTKIKNKGELGHLFWSLGFLYIVMLISRLREFHHCIEEMNILLIKKMQEEFLRFFPRFLYILSFRICQAKIFRSITADFHHISSLTWIFRNLLGGDGRSRSE